MYVAPHLRPIALLANVAAAAVLVAACGSSSSGSAHSTNSPAPAATSSTTTRAPSGGLNFTALGSLTNYEAEMTTGAQTYKVVVSSPTNWSQNLNNLAMIHVNGSVYSGLESSAGIPWTVKKDPANAYATSPYPGAVGQFTNMRKVTDVAITKGGACTVAGVAGHQWKIASPQTSAAAVTDVACVADSSGALLSLNSQLHGAVPGGGAGYSFAITRIGGVAPLSAPSKVSAG